MYTYEGVIIKVVDGDTVDARIDLGFHVDITERLRLDGINTPELTSKDEAERAKAQAAKLWLIEAFMGKRVKITTKKDKQEKYGRYLAKIYIDGNAPFSLCVNDEMVELGLAKAYDGTGPRT